MLIALITGYTVGAVLAFFGSKWLLRAIASASFAHDEQRRWIKWLGGIFAAMSFAPAIFLAMMFGGVIGGSYDHAVSEAMGMGDSGDLVVLAVRLAFVTLATVTANALVGAGCGFLIARGLYRAPAS